ncbi:MAG: hypothetical protein Q8K70_02510 [Bacteroidota bacterium]|nr:hypothetical protein [Bacteroidota bacterium]
MVQKLLLLFVFIVFLSSCTYEDGPKFSLISKKSRAVNIWELDKAYENGVDKTNDYKRFFVNYKIEIKKDDSYELSYNPLNIGKFTENGSWTFSDDKSKIIFTPNGTTQNNEWKILRLKNSECWVVQRIDGKDVELRLKD